MDFYDISFRDKKGRIEIYPDFKNTRSQDLMIRGKAFYAIWDEEKGLWSTDPYDVIRLVDQDLSRFKASDPRFSDSVVKTMVKFVSSDTYNRYKHFLREADDNFHTLDCELTFANTPVKKTDYVSKRLPYSLEEGTFSAYNELMSTIYDPDERQKLEWAIGAIVAGDAKHIQKFIVLYGDAGSGKSTFLNILEHLFEGYYIAFDSKALTSASNAFSTEAFRGNPLVAIQHDGDLSRIEDNTKLNSIVAHEIMTMNEKFKPTYNARSNAFLFMGTNKPVKITDAKAGVIRRLIDVRPSGNLIPTRRYHTLMQMIPFELGAIAWHCLKVYEELGKNYYSNYKPVDMMFQTNVFFNFVESNYHIFKAEDGVSIAQAYSMYKRYCEESLVEYKLPRHVFREELKSYFKEFHDQKKLPGNKVIRSYYSGFLADKFSYSFEKDEIETPPLALVLDSDESLLDSVLEDCPAQYATDNEIPQYKWSDVTTKLSDLDTHRLHYVQPPDNHIVIDFDFDTVDKNMEAASSWPATYAEFSKGGAGIHLHYIYTGDVSKLSRVYSDGIEIKVFTGQASLRRKLTKCNSFSISTISSGLPMKRSKKMINFDAVKSEKGLRDLIKRNLRKEIHPGTKPSIDFIYKILEDASKTLKYDISDLRQDVLVFASRSTNHADYCVKLVSKMKFSSEEPSDSPESYEREDLIFFDVEVFPNLFIVVWKAELKSPVVMINPAPRDIEELFKFKLVGFNNRRYDNHILYARYLGYSNEELYKLSQKIITGEGNSGLFAEAYNISYTDVYDFSSKKQSLKKFQIELGIFHKELGYKWDEPVPEDLWTNVIEYCKNDVVSLQAVFEDRRDDFIARLILADLSGLTPNDTTQQHTAKIIFNNEKRPQDQFIYTDLSKEFPGYVYKEGKSFYHGEETGEGGYVYAEPGMYSDVAVLDVVSMHPTSLVKLEMFGPYTKNFQDLLEARIAIKKQEYDKARNMLGGILSNYLTENGDSGALAYALKIVINIVYGLTSAKFDNRFRDPRNKDNIVAKRGALFMIDLKRAVQNEGFKVLHIKTDSIKIANATKEIIDYVFEFGKTYGYTFEHEDDFVKMCLVNETTYIAKSARDLKWHAVGAQFAHPYVFKTLFSHEPIDFNDLVEVKSVSTALYLDMNEGLGEDQHNYHFVGKVGAFCPVYAGRGGGLLLREKDDKYYAATGSKGYRWIEAHIIRELDRQDDIDRDYFNNFVDEAIEDISKFGDIEQFLQD